MKGRILKIKTGYNPNSSSIGVDMVVFFTARAAVMVLFSAIAAIIAATSEHGESAQRAPDALSDLQPEVEP